MTRTTIVGGVAAAALIFLALALAFRHARLERPEVPAGPPPATTALPPAATADGSRQGFLYGRVTTFGGASYEGRLRWGGEEEAFWGDDFNGRKRENRWIADVPPEVRPRESRPIEIFGLTIGRREREADLRRPFMARFGDITRIEAHGRSIRVTLKSGSALDLDRFEAGDFDDGVRVWTGARDAVDLDSATIRRIELLPTGPLGATPSRLQGTVRTRQGVFSGFVQWDREKCVGSDELAGRTASGQVRLRFETVRSIARGSDGGLLVSLLDGREIVLSGREAGEANRGTYVDDPRYGRVLVSRDAFERVDFRPGGSGPAYGDFPPGHPLAGRVTTRSGRRLAGRLVYDLDESETTETLDAPSGGVDYIIPFGLVTSIALPAEGEDGGRARVTLQDGEELRLELAGDLGEGNAGLLVFAGGRERPDYVPWSDVERVDLDRPYGRNGAGAGAAGDRPLPAGPP